MIPYPKIQSLYKRDMTKPGAPLIEGDFSRPEFYHLQAMLWEWTEKVDGMNIRAMSDGTTWSFRGRTDAANIPCPLLAELTEMFSSASAPAPNTCIYGEGYGPGIQKGGRYGPKATFIAFDVKIGDHWMAGADARAICADLGIPFVPTVAKGDLFQAVDHVRNGDMSSQVAVSPETMAEGLVLRPQVPLFNQFGERVITKVTVRDFRKSE